MGWMRLEAATLKRARGQAPVSLPAQRRAMRSRLPVPVVNHHYVGNCGVFLWKQNGMDMIRHETVSADRDRKSFPDEEE